MHLFAIYSGFEHVYRIRTSHFLFVFAFNKYNMVSLTQNLLHHFSSEQHLIRIKRGDLLSSFRYQQIVVTLLNNLTIQWVLVSKR